MSAAPSPRSNGHIHAAEETPFRRAPHNLEAEQALLGAILVNNEALGKVSAFLEPHHFYDPLHGSIYETAAKEIESGRVVTAITLRTYFEDAEPISPDLSVPQYLGTLAANATTIINAEDYGRTIDELALRRTAIVVGGGLVSDAYDDFEATAPEFIRKARGLLGEAEASGAGWPDPDPSVLNRANEAAPEMPLTGLPPNLATLVRTAAAALGAPTDYVGLAVITGAAGCIGARRHIEVWPGWKEPAIIWAALVGDPSTNKSPAIDPVREALIAVEAAKVEDYQPEEQKYNAAAVKAKAVKRAWEKAVEAAVEKGAPVPDMHKEGIEPKPPVRPRTWIANATLEKLARILAEQPGGIINFCDELSGLIGSFDRYGGEGGDRAFWLELFGGRPYRLDRVKDGSIDIPHMAVSLLGTIQPDRLHRLVLTGDNDGLSCRFWYAWPEPRPKKRPTAKPDPEVLRRAFKRLSSLDAGGASIVPVAADAATAFEAWWKGPHDAAIKGTSGMLAEAYGKMNGGVLRLALVFEYLAWATTPQWTLAEPTEVSRASIDAAIEFVDCWAKPMARRVFAEASVPQADRNAAVLARYLANARPTTINARQLRLTKKSALPGIRDAKAMDEACSALCDAGWLRAAFTRAGDGKGRKAKAYDVNPRLARICIAPHAVSSLSSARPVASAIEPKGANEVTPYTATEVHSSVAGTMQ